MRSIVRSALAAAVAVGLIGVAPVPALAAKPAPPAVVHVDATVSGFELAVRYSVSRSQRQIVQSTCEIYAIAAEVSAPTSCDPTAERKSTGKRTLYAVSRTVTTAGQFEFRVTFTLSDGTVVWGGDEFVIEPGPAVAFEVSGLRNQALYSFQPVASQVITVEAVDQYGNRATGYDGTVTFDGGDYATFEVLPPDSTLTNGRGVFVVNVGSSQNDCSYGDIPPPECYGYWRVTATDTVDPGITGFQRVTTIVYIVNLPSIFITPEGGVCSSCVTDPTGTVVIDTTQASRITEIVIDNTGTIQGVLVGTTTSGASFSADVTLTAPLTVVGGIEDVLVPLSEETQEIQVEDFTPEESDAGEIELDIEYQDPITGAYVVKVFALVVASGIPTVTPTVP